TWTYEGSVVQRFKRPALPGGPPEHLTFTPDPAANLLANSPLFPDFMGAYLATIHATMAGVGYTVSSAFEVNGDPLFFPPFITFPGFTALRELTESTDQGFFYRGDSLTHIISHMFPPHS